MMSSLRNSRIVNALSPFTTLDTTSEKASVTRSASLCGALLECYERRCGETLMISPALVALPMCKQTPRLATLVFDIQVAR